MDNSNSASAAAQAQSLPLCTLKAAEKWYTPRASALGPVSLEVFPGEVLGIRGPNGAGKSTLLSLIAGALKPEKGTCTLSPEARGRVGYVPQDLSLYQSLTVEDNLRFWGLAAGLPAKFLPIRIRWLLEQLDLQDKRKSRTDTCSGGMQRRLHLATALMVTPALLLLDEPTVGADPRSSGLILGMLEHLRDQGCGVVLISHMESDLERVCSRILTLEAGIITEEVRR